MTQVRYAVVRTGGWGGWIIRLATRSKFNHALVEYQTDDETPAKLQAKLGTIGHTHGTIEAEPHGLLNHVGRQATDAYPGAFTSDWIDGKQADKVLTWSLQHLGTKYGWLDILAIAIWCTSWLHNPDWVVRRLISTRTLICSQAVCEAYEFAGITLGDKPPGLTTPGDVWDIANGLDEPEHW